MALERDTIDEWASQLARISEVASDPLATRLLASPGSGTASKRRAVDAAVGPLSPEVGRLIELLLEHKRGQLLPALAEAYADRVRKHRGILRADVTSAVPLDEAEQNLLARRLQLHFGKQIEIHSQVDPRILGGVVARVGDQLLDGSVRGGLQRLRQQLEGQ